MKIIFDLRSTGLGNNGGSSTLVKSANTLQDLNNEVFIIDSGKNQHTWCELKVPHIIPKSTNELPNADVIISTGFNSVSHTVEAPKRCGNKFSYLRGWETWRMTEEEIYSKVLDQPTIKIVNSLGLQRKLMSLGIKSEVCYPGHDFDKITALRRRLDGVVHIGALFNAGSKRSGKRTNWIFDTIREVKRHHKDVFLWMYGIEGNPNNREIYQYTYNPSAVEKNDLYNHVHIWLAPTENEGLHIAPAEAMLTEACVVGTSAPLAGMDYLQHGETGFESKNNLNSFIDIVLYAISNPDYVHQLGIAGREKILSMGNRLDNMKKMVDILNV